MIKGKFLVALDGTHASGKTTLLHYIAAKLKEQGINCAVLQEPARNSPLLDDVILRDTGDFDIPIEADLIMNHISQCIRGTRDGDIILSDRTPVSVLAYTNLFVNTADKIESLFWESCGFLVERWMHFYDLIFYCQDFYEIDIERDKRRSKALKIQKDADLETKRQYERIQCDLQYIPIGLSLEERGGYVIGKIKNRLDVEMLHIGNKAIR